MPPKRRSASTVRSRSTKRKSSSKRRPSLGRRILNKAGDLANRLAPYAIVAAAKSPMAARLGRAVVKKVASKAAAPLLQASGMAMRYALGHGDYKITSNSLVGKDGGIDVVPQFRNVNRGVRVTHREYLFDVVTSGTAGAFTIQKVAIQPGVFLPWGSVVAGAFQQYQINGMLFEFKSFSSDALDSKNTALGQVLLATNYNCQAPDFTGTRQMQQSEFVTSVKPSESVIHMIECARAETPTVTLDVRTGTQASLPAGADIRLYDFANFYIATEGMQGESVNIGQLWVSWDITFLKTILPPSADVGDHFNTSNLSGVGLDATHFFGAPIAQPVPTSDLGATLTDNTITIPESFTGQLQVIWTCSGDEATGLFAPLMAADGIGITDLDIITGGGGMKYHWNNPTTDGATGQPLGVYFFKVNNGGVITLSSGGFPASPNAVDCWVLSYPYTLSN